MSQGRPWMWTAMIARVRGLILASIWLASSVYVRGSMSTKTGMPSCWRIGCQVPAKVNEVVMTSSPGRRSMP